MNKKRREELKTVVFVLENMKTKLYSIQDEEVFARENMPESLMDSAAYRNSEDCTDRMDDAVVCIDEGIENIKEIVNK